MLDTYHTNSLPILVGLMNLMKWMHTQVVRCALGVYQGPDNVEGSRITPLDFTRVLLIRQPKSKNKTKNTESATL